MLVERHTDSRGEYETRWMCTPPPIHVEFMVTKDEWNDDYTQRTIHGVRRSKTRREHSGGQFVPCVWLQHGGSRAEWEASGEPSFFKWPSRRLAETETAE